MTWPEPTHDSERARSFRRMFRGYSWCGRCGMPWAVVDGHITDYTPTSGCFPLCELCWIQLGSPEARIEYYGTLIEQWESQHPVDEETKHAIMKAVANGG